MLKKKTAVTKKKKPGFDKAAELKKARQVLEKDLEKLVLNFNTKLNILMKKQQAVIGQIREAGHQKKLSNIRKKINSK